MIVNLVKSLTSDVFTALLQRLMKGRLQLDKNLAGRQNKTLYCVLLYVQWSLYNMDTLGPTK